MTHDLIDWPSSLRSDQHHLQQLHQVVMNLLFDLMGQLLIIHDSLRHEIRPSLWRQCCRRRDVVPAFLSVAAIPSR